MKIFLNLAKSQRNVNNEKAFSPITLAKHSNDWLKPSVDKNLGKCLFFFAAGGSIN